jgi:hypothetical protein
MSLLHAPVTRAHPARPTTVRPRLTVVPPLRAPAPKAPFVLLVGALLTAGLGGLLFLHTSIAEDSFRLHDLTARSAVLADREQALDQEIAALAAPQRLAARARSLGMVRSENPAFIRTADGRILGKPKAGVAPPPKPKSTASAAAATKKTTKNKKGPATPAPTSEPTTVRP